LLGQTGFIGYTPGNNAYAQTIVNGLIAPANATSATVIFYCAGAAITNQSATIRFDDVSLSNTNGGGGGGGVVTTNGVQAAIAQDASITWFASNGVPYQVQWASDQINWNNLGGLITGNGNSNTVFDMPGQAGHNFYQVLSIQTIQSP
jgi:hypothetical protein